MSGCFKQVRFWIVYYKAIRTRIVGMVIGPDLQLKNLEPNKVNPLPTVEELIIQILNPYQW